jgi:parallel beta-helix repeat protein
MKAKRTSLAPNQAFTAIRLSVALVLLMLTIQVKGIDNIPDHPSSGAARAQSRVLPSQAANGSLTIGGFDLSRGGLGSFPSGDYFIDARAAITETYPTISFSAFSTVTQQATANLDVLVLNSATDEHSAILPLSNQEQDALTNYVELGGCAIVILDNDSFHASAPQANESLIQPFGLEITGTLSGQLIALVSDPSISPITAGPYGTVSSFIQNQPGGLTNLGPYATGIATNRLGNALAVIERDLMVEGSGPVVFYSDNDTFKSASAGGYFQSNRELFLNTITSCLSTHTVYLPAAHQDIACTVNKTTSGRMAENEIWCDDVLVTGFVEIPPGVNLTIQPGTTIRFTAQSNNQHSNQGDSLETPSTVHTQSTSIVVFGELDARGTPDRPIVFTSASDAPGTRDWESIAIEGGTVDLDHVVIEHGYFGLQLNTPTSQASVRHSTFRHVTTTGIATGNHPINGPIIVSDSEFVDCGREAIDTYRNQNFIVRHNVFSDNYVAIMSVGSSITIESNLFVRNSRGIGVVESANPTIIGNEFTNNTGAAIFVTDAFPLITYNNLSANLFNLQLEGSALGVTAKNNWWGSSEIETIKDSIWDGSDDPALGLVDFEPYAMDAFELDIPEYQ